MGHDASMCLKHICSICWKCLSIQKDIQVMQGQPLAGGILKAGQAWAKVHRGALQKLLLQTSRFWCQAQKMTWKMQLPHTVRFCLLSFSQKPSAAAIRRSFQRPCCLQTSNLETLIANGEAGYGRKSYTWQILSS